MALISIASAHGSPGATTLAVALAHRLAGHTARPALLLDADPDGGTIAARHGLEGSPSMTALAGAARQGIDPGEVLRFATEMPSGVPVLTAHPAADQAHAALRAAAAPISTAVAHLASHDTVADLGRLRPGSPARPFLVTSSCLVLVARPVVEQLVALADRVASVRDAVALRLVLVGDAPYSAAEVRRVLGIDDVTVIADDPRAVVADPAAARYRRRRSRWATGVDAVAATLAGDLTSDTDHDLEPLDPAVEALARATALVGDGR